MMMVLGKGVSSDSEDVHSIWQLVGDKVNVWSAYDYALPHLTVPHSLARVPLSLLPTVD